MGGEGSDGGWSCAISVNLQSILSVMDGVVASEKPATNKSGQAMNTFGQKLQSNIPGPIRA